MISCHFAVRLFVVVCRYRVKNALYVGGRLELRGRSSAGPGEDQRGVERSSSEGAAGGKMGLSYHTCMGADSRTYFPSIACLLLTTR